MISQDMKRHGMILKTYYKVKEANLKRLPTVLIKHVTFWKRQNYEER